MSDIPRYHAQPATLDPQVKLPENEEELPLAMGHDEDAAGEVKEALEEHRDAVQAEREARDEAREKGEREPGAVRTPDQVEKDEDEKKSRKDDKSESKPAAKKN